MPPPPKLARTVVALAAALGVDRSSFDDWRARFPSETPKARPNGRHDIAAWRKFMEERSLKGAGTDAPAATGKRAEEERKVRIANERAEIKLKHERGLYLSRSEVMAAITRVRAQERQAFTAFCDNVAMEFGHQGPEIAAKLRGYVKRMLEQLVVTFGDKEGEP